MDSFWLAVGLENMADLSNAYPQLISTTTRWVIGLPTVHDDSSRTVKASSSPSFSWFLSNGTSQAIDLSFFNWKNIFRPSDSWRSRAGSHRLSHRNPNRLSVDHLSLGKLGFLLFIYIYIFLNSFMEDFRILGNRRQRDSGESLNLYGNLLSPIINCVIFFFSALPFPIVQFILKK